MLPVRASDSLSVTLGHPIVLDLGSYDDVITLAPDRLAIEPLDGRHVRLTGGPRIGQAALLVLRGGDTQTISVQVVAGVELARGEQAHQDAQRPYMAYSGLVSAAGVDDSPPLLTTTHAVQASQELDDSLWWSQVAVRSRGDKWLLNTVALHLQNDRRLLHVGDNTVALSSQQIYLPLRGARAETQVTEGLRVGAVGGWWRDGSPTANFFQTTGSTAGMAYLHASHEEVFTDVQLGGLQTDRGPQLTTRALVGLGTTNNRVSMEVATLGPSLATSFAGQLVQGPATVRGRSMWRQAGFSPTAVGEADRSSHDLAGLFRLDREWTVSTIGAISTLSGTTGDTPSSTVAVAGTGLRYAPRDTLFFDANYRSGLFAQDGAPLTFATHAVGLSAERTSRERVFGRAQGELEVTDELVPTSGRYAFVAGYGEPTVWSTSAYLRGIRYSDRFDERMGLTANMRTSRTEWNADVGVSRFKVDDDPAPLSSLTPTTSPYSDPSYPWSTATYGTSTSITEDTEDTGTSDASDGSPSVAVAPSLGANGSVALTSGFRVAFGGARRFQTRQQIGSWRADAGLTVDGPLTLESGWSVGVAGTVAGTAFEDRNENGTQDADEASIEGLQVELDGLRTTHTDAQGRYRFAGVSQGTHTVKVQRAAWRSVAGGTHAVDVAWMQRADLDFAMRRGGHIQGRVFVDANLDGRYQPGEQGVVTDTVELANAAGEVIDTCTVNGGLFSFRGMGAGTYTVRVPMQSLPVGISSLGPATQQVSVGLERTAKSEFPMQAMRSISGQAWIDTNQSGVYEPTDAPAAGAWIHLSDGRVTKADDEGRYLFRRLPSGTYRVWLDPTKKSRPHRLSESPTEVTKADVFVTEERLAVVQRPEGLLAVRSDSPVLHAVAGTWMDDRFMALRNDLSRTRVADDRSWVFGNDEAVIGDAEALYAVAAGQSDVQLTVDGVSAPTIQVEVHDRAWSEALAAPSMLQLDVEETPGTVRGLVAFVGRTVIPLGDRSALNVTAVFSDGTVSRLDNTVDWDVDTDGIVTVSPDGFLVGDTVGRTTVTATLGDAVSVPVEIEVVADPVASLAIDRKRFELDVGDGARVSVMARHHSRRRTDVSGTVRWWTTDSDIAEVAPDGTVVGLKAGRTRLWASLGPVESASVDIVVQPRSIAGLSVDLPRQLVVGQRSRARGVRVVSDGSLRPLESTTWVSSDPSVLRMGADGSMEALRRGRVTVHAASAGATSPPVEVRVRRRGATIASDVRNDVALAVAQGPSDRPEGTSLP